MAETSRESKQRRREVSVSVEICGGSFFSFLFFRVHLAGCSSIYYLLSLFWFRMFVRMFVKLLLGLNATLLLYTAPLFIYYFLIFIFGPIVQLSSYFISSPALEFFFECLALITDNFDFRLRFTWDRASNAFIRSPSVSIWTRTLICTGLSPFCFAFTATLHNSPSSNSPFKFSGQCAPSTILHKFSFPR